MYYQLCEHWDEVRKATSKEFEEYQKLNPAAQSSTYLDVIHKRCETLPFSNYWDN